MNDISHRWMYPSSIRCGGFRRTSSRKAPPIAASELLDTRGADRLAHFRNLGLGEFLQVFRRTFLARGYVRNDVLEPLVHPGRVEGLCERCIEPADDRRGRALREEKSKPGADVEIGQALFGGARQARKLRRAFRLQNGDALDGLGFDQRLPVGLSVQM